MQRGIPVADGAAVSGPGIMVSSGQSKQTSFAAQSTITYSFGAGENGTYYEKDTKVDFIIRCAYADIPLAVSLVSLENAQVVASHKVESDEQATVELTIPADGN